MKSLGELSAATIDNARNAWRMNWQRFALPIVLFTFLLLLHGRFLLFLPFAYSLVVAAAVVALGLKPTKLQDSDNLGFWINRVGYYWLLMIMIGFIVLLIPVVVVGVLLVIVPESVRSASAFNCIEGVLCVTPVLYLGYRVWPVSVGTFLVAGRERYRWPWHRYRIFFWENTEWIGVGLLRSWRWTSSSYVRRHISPLAFNMALIAVLIAMPAIVVGPMLPFLVRTLVYLAVATYLSFATLVLVQSGWMALLLSGETPLIINPSGFRPAIPELGRLQKEHERSRVFVCRFPEGSGEYVTLTFPTGEIDALRAKLLTDLQELGFTQSRHNGQYLQFWESSSDYRNDQPSVLIVDLQSSIMGVLALDRNAPLYDRFRALLMTWRATIEIGGDIP